MSKEIGFHFGALSETLEEQANQVKDTRKAFGKGRKMNYIVLLKEEINDT